MTNVSPVRVLIVDDHQLFVLSASLAVEDAHCARSAGAAAYLTKDCFMRDVIDAPLEVALSTHRRKEETAYPRGLRAPPAAGPPQPLLQSHGFSTH
jgi:hypothetical protein